MEKEINQLIAINRRLSDSFQGGCFRANDVFCITADHQRVLFLNPKLIFVSLVKLLEKVEERIEDDAFEALAIFWIGFISIHPFTDANGRTAKEYLLLKIKKMGFVATNLTQIDSILLTENTSQNITLIKNFLEINLKIKELV